MIVVVGGIKGGTGKTTIATNLATHNLQRSCSTLIIDADEQGSACDWSNQRPDEIAIPTTIMKGGKIHREIQSFKDKYDRIIVDVGGRDTITQRSALTVADTFLIPFKPRSFDIWTLGAIRNMIDEVLTINPKLKCYYVINQGDSRGSDNTSAIQILSEFPSLLFTTVIGHRKIFADAASEGKGINEMPKKDDKATSEIETLMDCIYPKYK